MNFEDFPPTAPPALLSIFLCPNQETARKALAREAPFLLYASRRGTIWHSTGTIPVSEAGVS